MRHLITLVLALLIVRFIENGTLTPLLFAAAKAVGIQYEAPAHVASVQF